MLAQPTVAHPNNIGRPRGTVSMMTDSPRQATDLWAPNSGFRAVGLGSEPGFPDWFARHLREWPTFFLE